MSKADRYRRIADRERRRPARDFDLYPYQVFVRTSSRAGSYSLEGAETASEIEITNGGYRVKVRQLNTEELALNNMGAGGLSVGPITPSYPEGGIDFSDLTTAAEGSMLLFRVVGPEFPNGAYFRLFSANSDRALHYTLTLYPDGNVPA